jgi:CreA protein
MGQQWISRLLAGSLLLATSLSANADPVGCVTTAWKLIGANHKVCVEAFSDPKVPGVTCHVSQARTGGVSGSLGLAQDPSQFSLACRQTGQITLPARLPRDETVFAEDTSILFKETRIVRLWDEPNRTLVYLAISRKLIEGAPATASQRYRDAVGGSRSRGFEQCPGQKQVFIDEGSNAMPADGGGNAGMGPGPTHRHAEQCAPALAKTFWSRRV